MFNETENQLFVFHYDTQKGVGKKFNFSQGFKRVTSKTEVERRKHEIPGYDYYKQMFESCDNFNKGLHDKSWPFKAGGKGVKGASGTENAFSMACILQNTFNAFHQITGRDSKDDNFQNFMCILADQIFLKYC